MSENPLYFGFEWVTPGLTLEFETFDDVLATSKEMANEIVQNVIKDITAENPHLVSELLAINFSDLIKIFNLKQETRQLCC